MATRKTDTKQRIYFSEWIHFRKLRQWQVAEAMGSSPGKISKLISGDQQWTESWLQKAATALQLDVIDLFSPPPNHASVNDELPPFSAGLRWASELHGAIPQIDAEAGAGNGTVGEVFHINSGGISSGHRITDQWVVPRADLGTDPSRVIVLPVVGTSMMPSLLPGDKVMVDTGSSGIKNGEIYVLDEGDGPIVKRVRVLRDEEPITIEIISENPSVSPFKRPADLVRIIGRVIGKWTKM